MENKTLLHIKGMHCASCELVLEQEINKSKRVSNVKANLKKQTVEIEGDFESKNEILQIVENLIKPLGYSAHLEKPINEQKKHKDTLTAMGIAGGIITLFLLLQKYQILDVLNVTNTSYGAVFLIGIAASLSSCAAVVGGLILSLSSTLAKQKAFTSKTIWAFHASRIISFFILGGLIGLIGSAVKVTPLTTIILNGFLAFVMVILGLNLLELFDFTKKLQVKLPSSFFKKISKNKNNSIISSALLGMSTFFLPCGFTQSMQVYALSSQNFFKAGVIMLVFALGTLPVLFLITLSSKSFSSSKYSKVFFKTAGILVIVFGLFNLYNALVVAQLIG